MQRHYSYNDRGRLLAPIFGCRKRSRQAVYADPIDLPSHNNDDTTFFTVESQLTRCDKSHAFAEPNQEHQLCENYKGQNPNKQQSRSHYARNVTSLTNFKSNNTRGNKIVPAYKNNPNDDNCDASSLNFCPSKQVVDNRFQGRTPVEKENTKKEIYEDSSHIQRYNHHQETSKVETKNKKATESKIITTAIKELEKWVQASEHVIIYFELFGTLDSTIAVNNPNPQKSFSLRDSTGSIRCIFWEVDRRLPKISRKSLVRCIGRWKSGYFHCISLRCLKKDEQIMLEKLAKICETNFNGNSLLSREL